MMEMLLEIIGELILRSKKIKPWVKTAFVCMILLVLAALLIWGLYMDRLRGGPTKVTVFLSLLIAAALVFGFWYAFRCHRNNWDKY